MLGKGKVRVIASVLILTLAITFDPALAGGSRHASGEVAKNAADTISDLESKEDSANTLMIVGLALASIAVIWAVLSSRAPKARPYADPPPTLPDSLMTPSAPADTSATGGKGEEVPPVPTRSNLEYEHAATMSAGSAQESRFTVHPVVDARRQTVGARVTVGF
jgi:hypothetical protein